MHELLVDELTGDQVVVAPGRALRPGSFRVVAPPRAPSVAGCPFCEGNEDQTPPEVARVGPGAPDTPGWRVRVVPNKYPVVGDAVPGAHEVVVLSPAHDADVADLDAAASADVFSALRDRTRFHLARGLAYVQPFVNHGKAAGASIEHPHAQLLALEFVPARVSARLERFTRDAFARDQQHVVEGGSTIVWCPRASASPFAMRVALAEGGARFEETSDGDITLIAAALRDAVTRLHRVLGDPAYNVVVVTAPPSHTGPFRWWVDVVPRLTVVAGFEMGTGLSVNVVRPGDAAGVLRGAR
jgi:UDPglucose--hexose-1-phosphate uridylyltransferase